MSLSRVGSLTLAFVLVLVLALAPRDLRAQESPILLIGVSDSLGHGTMDATNNYWATANATFSRVYYSLASVRSVYYSEPWYDFSENRIYPYTFPTNLSVDGADVFSIEGIEYGKRVGSTVNLPSTDLLADVSDPALFQDDYDKVLSPINYVTGTPMSQVDSAIWLVNQWPYDEALLLLWIGNNDSSLAALGLGGRSPSFQPVPLAHIAREIDANLFLLLVLGALSGEVSFQPYTQASILRNLTDIDDFAAQYDAVLTRLSAETAGSGVTLRRALMTLPYYSAVGYLMDSDDLEFYLRKLAPSYTVPPTFRRVNLPEEPLSGDRISLVTFGFMYWLLASGYSTSYVNSILEYNGAQVDGFVMSEAEQAIIMGRIDAYNDAIRSLAAKHGAEVVETGPLINGGFLGDFQIPVEGKPLTRKWVRGGGLTFDGVHPNPTGASLIASYILWYLNAYYGYGAPLYDLEGTGRIDPYRDHDGDGFAKGPPWTASGRTELLHLFRDTNDQNPSVGAVMPADLWDRVSRILLEIATGVPALEADAREILREIP